MMIFWRTFWRTLYLISHFFAVFLPFDEPSDELKNRCKARKMIVKKQGIPELVCRYSFILMLCGSIAWTLLPTRLEIHRISGALRHSLALPKASWEQPALASLESQLSDSASLGYLRHCCSRNNRCREAKLPSPSKEKYGIPEWVCHIFGGEREIWTLAPEKPDLHP